MTKEMLKFVEENFEVIKNKFSNQERDLIMNYGFGIEDEMKGLDYLDSQIEDTNSAEELIDVINERSIGIDLDDKDEVNELFNMIKSLKE